MYHICSIQGFFLITLLLFSTKVAFAQNDPFLPAKERKAIAIKEIKTLKDGVLVVRLPSNSKKMAALQALIDGGKLKKATLKRTQEQLESTKYTTKLFSETMIRAFEAYYQFSDVLFMYDTAATQLKGGQLSGFFLNDSLEVAPSAGLKDTSFLVLRFGLTRSSRGQSIEAAVLMDRQMDDMLPPFPYYVKMNNFSSIMGTLFPKTNQFERSLGKAVRRLNAQLFSYYGRYY